MSTRKHRAASQMKRREWTGGSVIEHRYWASNPIPQHKQDEVSLMAYTALTAITTGSGTDEHLGALSLACNMSYSLAMQGIGAEAMELVIRANDALHALRERHTRTGKYGFTAPELEAVRDMLHVHDRMVAAASQQEIRNALKDIDERHSEQEIAA